MRQRSVLALRAILFCVLALPIAAKHKVKPQLILSTAHPKDSRGETVYQTAGPNDKGQAPVPGVFVAPKALSIPAPQYTPDSRDASVPLHVSVEGVVAQNGDLIDGVVADGLNDEVSKAVRDSLGQAHFKAATLDGKPIALFTHVDILVYPK